MAAEGAHQSKTAGSARAVAVNALGDPLACGGAGPALRVVCTGLAKGDDLPAGLDCVRELRLDGNALTYAECCAVAPGLGRIVVSATEAPNMLANLV